MDAAELDRRFRMHDGWVPPLVARALIEHGHHDGVRREAASGDYFCARALADDLDARDDRDGAIEVLRPFADTGWWEPISRTAALLAGHGDTDAAIAVLRPQADAGARLAVSRLAELLAGQGRLDEAIALLTPGLAGEWLYAEALVSITAGQGRDDEVVDLLRPLAEPPHGPDCRCDGEAERRLATVLERRGSAGEAIELLASSYRRGDIFRVNHIELLSEFLARHDPDRLRAFADNGGGEYAAERLAQLLADLDRVDEAIEVLRPHPPWYLADLLIQLGRVGEAIEVLRPAALDDPECYLPEVRRLMLEQGRAGELLTFMDEFRGDAYFELLTVRADALVALGRVGEAVEVLRAGSEADSWYVRCRVAGILAEDGQVAEAVRELWPYRGAVPEAHDLARLLVVQGRVEEAFEVVRGLSLAPPMVPDGPPTDEPPF
ncbi:hypothetical protein AB0M02_45240 [Actinoplanes sp. NPDC051861]|uniref:tetratricopeptide repeat protein n=1 Tax=Actinoplanes sp. NPDC051861 TaxID=3155170 RepID=UPI00343BBF47